MFSTPFPQLILIFVAFLCVVVTSIAWVFARRATKYAAQMAEYSERLHDIVSNAVADLPETAWRAEVDSTLADHRDSIAQLGATLRRLNARNAARARHDKQTDDPVPSGDDKDALRQLARSRGMLK